MSIDVKPYTAFVVCPVPVRKFSAGSAKNARYASECPSSSIRRRSATGCVTSPAAVFFGAALRGVDVVRDGVRVAGLIRS